MTESEMYRRQAADKLRIADLLDQNKKLKHHLAENNRPQEESPTVSYNFFGILMALGIFGGGAYYYLFEVGF